MKHHYRGLARTLKAVDEYRAQQEIALCFWCGTEIPSEDTYPYCSTDCANAANRDSQEDHGIEDDYSEESTA